MKKALFMGASLLLCCCLCACGGGDEEGAESAPAVQTYTLGGDTIPALEEVLTTLTGGERTGVLTTPPLTAEQAKALAKAEEEAAAAAAAGEDGEASDEEDAAAAEAPAEEEGSSDTYAAYDYQRFVEGQSAAAASAYFALLTNEENALRYEGDAATISFETAAGSVSLYRQAVLVGADGAATLAASAAPADDSAEGEDGEGEPAEEPESEAPAEGTLLPYSSYETDGQMRFVVRIDWTPSSCLVTLERTAGQDFNTSLQDAGTFLSFSSAKILLNSVQPEEIGLSGESMAEYSLKPGPGFVMVDGRACLTIYAYRTNEINTNSLAATYFISSDSSTLYRQVSPGQVEEIDVPDVVPEEETPAADGEPAAEGDADSGNDADGAEDAAPSESE